MAGLTVAFDTNCFIYYLQGPQFPTLHAILASTFHQMEEGQVFGFASVLALGEVRVGPLKQGMVTVADRIYLLLKDFPNLRFIPVTEEIMLLAAEYRAKYGFKMPDAIHLATAKNAGVQQFLTNDAALQRISEVPVVLLSKGIPGGIQ